MNATSCVVHVRHEDDTGNTAGDRQLALRLAAALDDGRFAAQVPQLTLRDHVELAAIELIRDSFGFGVPSGDQHREHEC